MTEGTTTAVSESGVDDWWSRHPRLLDVALVPRFETTPKLVPDVDIPAGIVNVVAAGRER